MKVDRSLPTPLHVQVRELIRDRIDSEQFVPGSRLPTETELAGTLGVHRLTVRQAMADLARTGMIDVRQGVGTFVADVAVPIEVSLTPEEWLTSSARTARAYADRGIEVSHRLVSAARATTRGDVRRHLEVDDALVVETVQSDDGRPSMRALHWVVTDADHVEPFDGSVGERLTDLVGAPMFYAWRAIGAVSATPEDAASLDVPVGAALLQRSGVNVDATGRPVMYVDRRFRGDHIRFVVTRSEPLPGPGDH